MNENIPTYPQLPKKPEDDPVAKSIAKPHAFAKAGTMGKAESPKTRFRPLATKGKVRQRKRKPDRRHVEFF